MLSLYYDIVILVVEKKGGGQRQKVVVIGTGPPTRVDGGCRRLRGWERLGFERVGL